MNKTKESAKTRKSHKYVYIFGGISMLLAIAIVFAVISLLTSTPTSAPKPAPGLVPAPSGSREIRVSNADELTKTLIEAQPGDVITLANGTYAAKSSVATVGKQKAAAAFRISTSGTADKPIIIQGSREAIIDGDGTGGDYGLHLFKANYVQLRGLRVANAKKGIVLDGSNNNILDGVMVDTVGQEAVHFRTNSSRNIIKNSVVKNTGLETMGYGEGIYIGSDGGNWDKLNGGKPDESDHNTIIGNQITEFRAEGVDIKEASSHNLVKENYFDGALIGGTDKANSADSWVDIKGDHNTITENSGVNVLMFDKNSSAAFQTHVHGPDGYDSASYNTFSKNSITLNGPGYGFWIDPKGKGNTVSCNNQVSKAGKGLANIDCR